MPLTPEQYDQLKKDHGAMEMVRPFWEHQIPTYPENLTVIICQGADNRTTTQMTLESLLRFYPSISVLIVNGQPGDFDSHNWSQLASLKYPNVKIWDRGGLNSHGDMMNDAIRDHISTEFVMLLDNDNVIHRPGLIEGMLKQLEDPQMFATGPTMIVSKKGEACGIPLSEADILLYAHPSCAIIKRSIYMQEGIRPFCNHGAPCVFTMIDVQNKGYTVGSFPVDQYESHLSGHSWCVPQPIWYNDHDVYLRPFLTFVLTAEDQVKWLQMQSDKDFDIVPLGKKITKKVVIHEGSPHHPVGHDYQDVDNRLYDIRFRVHGEYVCVILEMIGSISSGFVATARDEVVKQGYPDEINLGDLRLVKRKVWQNVDCLLNKF